MNTISDAYRQQQVELHTNPNYGVASLAFAPLVAKLIVDNGIKSLCDYGAGKKHLQTALQGAGLDLVYHPYDPAFPEYGAPTEADMVCCIDVLEHIEPDRLDAVLCLVQAAWAQAQHDSGHPNYGLPSDIDALEGWIVSA